MRQYKFRGKRIDTNEWVYGSYVQDAQTNTYSIWSFEEKGIKTGIYWKYVNKDTVGMCLDRVDIHGVEVYEGDKVRVKSTMPKHDLGVYEVYWKQDEYRWALIEINREGDEYGAYTRNPAVYGDTWEVVGCIHD